MPLTISHAKSLTMGDSTASTQLVRPSDWNSGHSYTLSLAASEIASLFSAGSGLARTTDSNGLTFAIPSASYFEPFPFHNTNSTLSAPGAGTWYFDPFFLPLGADKGQINLLVSNAAGFLLGIGYSGASTGSASFVQTFRNQLAIYKQGSSVSTTRLETVWTGDCSMLFTQSISAGSNAQSTRVGVSNYLTASFPAQFDTAGGVTYSSTSVSGTASTASSTMASTYADSLITAVVAYISGARMDIVGLSTTLGPGNYWLAHMFTSTSSGAGTRYTAATLMQAHSRLGLLENAVNAYRRVGQSVSNSISNVQPFHGYFATTTSGAPATVGSSDIRATTGRVYWNYQQSTY